MPDAASCWAAASALSSPLWTCANCSRIRCSLILFAFCFSLFPLFTSLQIFAFFGPSFKLPPGAADKTERNTTCGLGWRRVNDHGAPIRLGGHRMGGGTLMMLGMLWTPGQALPALP